MPLALLIILAVWAMALLMVMSLCVFAKRGDEALTATAVRASRRPRGAQRTRGAQGCGARVGVPQR